MCEIVDKLIEAYKAGQITMSELAMYIQQVMRFEFKGIGGEEK